MSLFSRLKNALHSKQLDNELLDEMKDHLERRAAALHEKGLPPADAKREAERRFGNITQIREQSRDYQRQQSDAALPVHSSSKLADSQLIEAKTSVAC